RLRGWERARLDDPPGGRMRGHAQQCPRAGGGGQSLEAGVGRDVDDVGGVIAGRHRDPGPRAKQGGLKPEAGAPLHEAQRRRAPVPRWRRVWVAAPISSIGAALVANPSLRGPPYMVPPSWHARVSSSVLSSRS